MFSTRKSMVIYIGRTVFFHHASEHGCCWLHPCLIQGWSGKQESDLCIRLGKATLYH